MNKILYILLIFIGIVYSQESDSIRVSADDWKFIQQTFYQVDSALAVSDSLNTLYDKRVELYKIEVDNLRLAGIKSIDIIKFKNDQLRLRERQIEILRNELLAKNLEIWIYRGTGIILIISTIFLIK